MNASHHSILTVDLTAVEVNYRRLQHRAPKAEIAPVLKGDAYSLGAAEIALRLSALGARSFFVAYLCEGIALRRILGSEQATIYVLTGQHENLCDEYLKHDLTPVLNNVSQLSAWQNAAKKAGQKLPAIFQLDVGLKRIGFEPRDFAALTDDQCWRDDLTPELVLAHLPCANERNAERNRDALESFKAATAGLPGVRRSLASSAGIYLGDEFQFDLVRPGSALLGVNPIRGRQNPMAPVAFLDTRIIELRHIGKGERFGYAGGYKADRNMRIAIISIGTADGFSAPKTPMKRPMVLVGSNPAQLIGTAGSDMSFVDVTDIAEDAVQIGQTVNLLGSSGVVEDRAAEAGLSEYDYLSKFSSRLVRHFSK